MAFRPVITAAELWDGDLTAKHIGGRNVLLVRLHGVVYAYEDRCAHLGVALSEGTLNGHVLTCRAHHWQYDVRTGKGVNPVAVCLRRFEVKLEDGDVLVDVDAPSPDVAEVDHVGDGVGPVLIKHPAGFAVLEAIRRLNPSADVYDRSSYLRVLVPARCLLTRRAVEDILGRPFDFRADLEIMMPSFKGRMRLDDDEAVWTLEAEAGRKELDGNPREHRQLEICNATPSLDETPSHSDDEAVRAIDVGTAALRARSRQERVPQRTYWHLSDLGRKPTDYDIATSRLHYWTARGFEVKMPLSDWYERWQRGTELRCRDWEQWSDPRQTTYPLYTGIQRTREAFVNGLLDSISDEYDRRLSTRWVALLDRVLTPLRYPGHGLQMVTAYVGKMAPSARISIAATFQAADEMRRIERLAYRMRQLQMTHPTFGSMAQQTWQCDPIWQPLREVIEALLVTWDWGEAFVALQFVLKPAFDELFMTHFARLARVAGDDVLELIFSSLNEDCAWHRAWSESLLLTAIRDTPQSARAIERWIENWVPRVSRAVSAFQPIYDGMSKEGESRFATVVNEIEQFERRCRGAFLTH